MSTNSDTEAFDDLVTVVTIEVAGKRFIVAHLKSAGQANEMPRMHEVSLYVITQQIGG